jgi:outer membrane protein
MKKTRMAQKIVTILLGVMLVAGPSQGVAQAEHQPPVVNVSIVTDGPWERGASLRALFLEEMRAVNRGEFDIRAPAALQVKDDWTLGGVRRTLDKVLADPRTDVVVTLGVLASHAAAHRDNLPKPVVAPFIADRKVQQLPYKDGASGKKNLSYVSLDVDIHRDLEVFRDVVPFSKLTFLIDGAMAQALPGLAEEVTRTAQEFGFTVALVTVGSSAAQTLAAIPADTQAVYVGPLLRLPSAEYARLVTGLIERRLPSFAFSGKSDVERGLLLGVAPALHMERLARRVALNIRRILLGEPAASLPVAFARQEGLVLNMHTARAIGFSPNWKVLTRAELLHEEPEPQGPALTLADAVRQAVQLNLSIRIAKATVAAGKENIRRARSALLPQFGLSGQGVAIEKDDARAIPGQAERTTTGSVTLDQTLYSEPAWSNYAIQKHLQTARENQREQVQLDIVLETAQTYIDVLRAKTNERVQKDNLRLTRSNRELAQTRRRIGTAGPSEVLRWESEAANAQRAVVEAQAQTRVAEIALNALLHRPLDDLVATVEVGLDEPELITSQQRLFDLIENPASFRALVDFVVQEGLASVPELRRINAQIDAQQRTLASARHAFWQPKLNLRADRSEIFARSGARAAPLPGMDDTQTTVSLQLSLPLFTSGARSADKQQAVEELTGLRLQRDAAAERVNQRIRSSLYIARSALTAIRLSREAADAAQSNLDVVRDAYSRGTVSILDLLDAQNAALVADLRSATGVYDFVRDLMEVERAAARFDFFLTPQDQADWFTRLERNLKEHDVPVPKH